METEPVPRCPACGSSGDLIYHDLEDHHFGTPGVWHVRMCVRCRSLWLDPRPSTQELHLAYEVYYTHGEATNPPGGDIAKHVLRMLPSHRDDASGMTAHVGNGPGRVLDLGCGDGRTAVALQSAGWTVVAMDQDPASIAAARVAGATDARVGTINDLPDTEERFDAVVLSHVIEHLVEPIAALVEIRRHLRPGGQLVILTPNAASASHQRFRGTWRGLEVPRHLQILSADGLRHMLDTADLTLVELRTSSRGANGVARASGCGRPASGSFQRVLSYAAGEVWQARVEVRRRRDAFAGEELVARAEA